MSKINVHALFGDFAVSDADGEALHERIENELKSGEVVVVDFTNVETVLTQFLNTAIATLYKEHTSDELREKLEIKGLKSTDSLRRVIARAKTFYCDEKKAKELISEEGFYE